MLLNTHAFPSRIRIGSFYGGSWEIAFEPYDGVDFSRLCWLFSGQGTAYPGMFLNAYRELEVVRQRFDEADTLAREASLPRPSLYVTGAKPIPPEALVMTRNLATFTAQVALFDYLLTCLAPPRLLTGSSQGEYAALVCAGASDFATLFEVNIARHRICGRANHLGYLLAIAAPPLAIAAALGDEPLHVSIVNSPVRTVLAVAPERLGEAQARLKRAGIGAKLLEVPHPYHSPLMQGAARRFRRWLDARQLDFRAPRCPILSSVTREVITDALSASEAAVLLSRQLTEPVDFPQQIEIAYDRRCYAFLEVGPGATLGTFVRRILGKRAHQIRDLDALLPSVPLVEPSPPPRLEGVRSRIFGAMRKAIARLTGYEIESISIEDRFQEDLAIDSLKKLEVLVEVMREVDPDREKLSEFATVQKLAEAVEAFACVHDQTPEEAVEQTGAPAEPAHFERCVPSWRHAPLAVPAPDASLPEPRLVPLKALLERRVRLDDLIAAGSLGLIGGAEDFSDGVHATRPETTREDVDRLLGLFELFQPLRASLQDRTFDLALATASDSHPYTLGLAGFFKALMQEVPGLGFKHLDFDQLPSEPVLVERIRTERADRRTLDVRYVGGVRQVATLSPLPEPASRPSLPAEAVIVAFGGAKGITKALLESLAAGARPHLFLAGRSPELEVAEALASLSTVSAELRYTALDARDGEAVAGLLRRVCAEKGRIDLVLNAVGIEQSGLLAHKTREAMRAELEAKLLVTRHILRAAAAVSARLVVSFGSLAGRWGNAGQTVYACANTILGRLTEAHNCVAGRVAAVTIEWPAFNGVGMTADPAMLHQLRRRGLSMLGIDRAATLLADDMRRPEQGIVTCLDRADAHLVSVLLTDRRCDRALLGDRTEDGAYLRVFDRRRDVWLDDHMIDGVSYVPAATAIAMALGFATRVEGRPACLDDFEMLQAIPVRTALVPLRLELAKTAGGLRLVGCTDTVHFRCRLDDPELLGLEGACCPPAELPPAGGPAPWYGKDLLFHGRRFQVLHHCRIESGSAKAWIETARLLPIHGIEAWDRTIQWIDGAFQLLGLAARLEGPTMAVPVGVVRIESAAPRACPAFIRLETACPTIDNGEICGDVIGADASGRVLLRLHAVRLRLLSVIGSASPPSRLW
jgi:malonyl CoA-acyl carrier protein transacylase/NAD(P)-dependent dehydrogenase (short-subunit alcohol dehydrogenase family)/acyl carrier protein